MPAFLLPNIGDYLWINITQMNGNILVEEFFNLMTWIQFFFFLQKIEGKKKKAMP